ncbi:MAG: PCRF domain-containing protein, partial [Proteobacteria bacterium]|nr:PCRF domain-containing protein [Pseudomonadota bacterium]
MKDSIRNKLEFLAERQEELNALVSDPETMSDQNKYRALTIELSEITPVVTAWEEYQQTDKDISAAEIMLTDDDADMRDMGKEELTHLKTTQENLFSSLQRLLLPKDPNDDR